MNLISRIASMLGWGEDDPPRTIDDVLYELKVKNIDSVIIADEPNEEGIYIIDVCNEGGVTTYTFDPNTDTLELE